ncbi:hypothetical protein [Acidianus manzaensis]|uniref:Uncharacterized protein n=1 Tax=Acidianus manzaensis TaxID=282676 RepID=A0A1W6JWY8_9CREN|nr:hypothetical protein [Acidianus manzaensis]ARM74765.1 hypothetical protein B6F84_01140 [Acidianus manzaensis]
MKYLVLILIVILVISSVLIYSMSISMKGYNISSHDNTIPNPPPMSSSTSSTNHSRYLANYSYELLLHNGTIYIVYPTFFSEVRILNETFIKAGPPIVPYNNYGEYILEIQNFTLYQKLLSCKYFNAFIFENESWTQVTFIVKIINYSIVPDGYLVPRGIIPLVSA